jgi:hypothetical protein
MICQNTPKKNRKRLEVCIGGDDLMAESPYDFKVTGAIFCHHCGKEIRMGETCVFMLGRNYHTGCDKKAILGETK